jgi:hypothetical protein
VSKGLLTVVDKVYWSRIAMAMVAGMVGGVLSVVYHTDYYYVILLGIYVYLASYYAARLAWRSKMTPAEIPKLYTAGIGGFFMLFLFFWVLFYTLNI